MTSAAAFIAGDWGTSNLTLALCDEDGQALETRKAALEGEALALRLANECADVTLPVRPGAVADGRLVPAPS